MADDDNSLDGGYLGEKLGRCYEQIGDLHAAKYWYGRAVEENPAARTESIEARKRLSNVTIHDLLVGSSSPEIAASFCRSPLPNGRRGNNRFLTQLHHEPPWASGTSGSRARSDRRHHRVIPAVPVISRFSQSCRAPHILGR
jgi:hypothetical protein